MQRMQLLLFFAASTSTIRNENARSKPPLTWPHNLESLFLLFLSRSAPAAPEVTLSSGPDAVASLAASLKALGSSRKLSSPEKCLCWLLCKQMRSEFGASDLSGLRLFYVKVPAKHTKTGKWIHQQHKHWDVQRRNKEEKHNAAA